MIFKPVLLWSDALVFLLLAGVAALVWLARNQEHLRDAWRHMMGGRLGSASVVVLAVYLAIGLLDSLHYQERLSDQPGRAAQYGGEVLSVLDTLLASLRKDEEKTYSAPFATHLYVKESMPGPDGREARDYPRLKFGGADLADPERDFWPDILKWSGTGLGGGLAAGLLLVAVLGRFGGRRHSHRALLSTVMAISLLIGLLIALAPHYHVLGTDKVGQDVLYLSLKSIRTGLLIGTLTTLVMLPFALALGIAAGYFGGRVDDLIQYLYTTLNSIPGVLLIAAAVLVVQVQIEAHAELFDTAAARSDVRLLALCAILGLTGWTGLARLLRAEALKLRELEFVQAARAFGLTHTRILVRHLLPNVMHLVLISVVIDFSGLVLAEAVLSYVGVGVDPAMNSFGNMINGARLELAREPVVWWQLAAAFLFMFVLVLAANLFADALRDALDPKRGERA